MTHRRLTNPKPNRRPGNAPLVQHSQKGHQRPQVQVQYINGFHGWNCRAGKPTSQKPQSDRTASHSASSNHERSEEHTSELQSRPHLVCRLLLEKKKKTKEKDTKY